MRDVEPGELGQFILGELFMLFDGSCDSQIDNLFEFILNWDAIWFKLDESYYINLKRN